MGVNNWRTNNSTGLRARTGQRRAGSLGGGGRVDACTRVPFGDVDSRPPNILGSCGDCLALSVFDVDNPGRRNGRAENHATVD